MAIAFDARTVGADYSLTGTQTISHTAGATARAAVVLIEQNGANTDEVGTVSYNGVAMDHVLAAEGGESTEAGYVHMYFLDGITGQGSAVNVSMQTTGSTTKTMVVATISVATNKAVSLISSNFSSNAGAANPTVTLSGLTASTQYMFMGVIHSGLNTMTTTPGSPFSATAMASADRGNQGYGMAQGVATTTGTTQACVWTAATSDDYAFGAAAFQEVAVNEIGVATQTSVNNAETAVLGAKQIAARVPGFIRRLNLIGNPTSQTSSPWTVYNSTGTLTWDNTVTRSGAGSSKFVVGTASGGLSGVTMSVSGLTVGKQYLMSAYVRWSAGTSYNLAVFCGNYGSSQTMSSATGTNWLRSSGTFVATATSMSFYVLETSGNVTGDTWYADDLLVEEDIIGSGTVRPYFDGVNDDQANPLKLGQGWTGTAHASTSYINELESTRTEANSAPVAAGFVTSFRSATATTADSAETAVIAKQYSSSASATATPSTSAIPGGTFYYDITGSDSTALSASPGGKTYGTLTGAFDASLVGAVRSSTA